MLIYDYLRMPKWDGSRVKSKAHGLDHIIQERTPNSTTPPSPIGDAISDPTLEQIEATLPDERGLAKVEANRKRKASTSEGTSARSSRRKRPARRSSGAESGVEEVTDNESKQEYNASESHNQEIEHDNDDQEDVVAVLHIQPLRSAGVVPRDSGVKDLGNQDAEAVVEAPLNVDDHIVDGGHDYSDGDNEADVNEQSSSGPHT
ncbi:hypothetical protein Tco_1491608 [Tanacetum coccineum]